jgi:uncharacterized membrane protein YfcA
MKDLHILNGIVSIITAAALAYVVLHPRVKEGLWIKAGLIVMCLSMIGSAAVSFSSAQLEDTFNAAFALRTGVLIVCIGYAIKYRKRIEDDHHPQT